MIVRKWLAAGLACLLLAGCGYDEVEVEVGYKGKARLNPWLAAERFAAAYGFEVESLTAWQAPEADDSVWFVPASVLNNGSFIGRAETWADNGGHLVVLLDHAGAEVSDWRGFNSEVEVEGALVALFERHGIKLNQRENDRKTWFTDKVEIGFEGGKFNLEAGAGKQVAVEGGTPGVFASVEVGKGRISAVADARIFRNRWLGDQDHAALLLALIDAADFEGSVRFSRGSSLSLWAMLARHLWAVLLGLCALLVIWLWRSAVRFGPLEGAQAPDAARSYDHHLEALGGFHWRTCRARDLLAPLRERILEHALRMGHRAGHRAEDIHQWLAARSGLSVGRVSHALAPNQPADGVALTRTVADLQQLYRSLL